MSDNSLFLSVLHELLNNGANDLAVQLLVDYVDDIKSDIVLHGEGANIASRIGVAATLYEAYFACRRLFIRAPILDDLEGVGDAMRAFDMNSAHFKPRERGLFRVDITAKRLRDYRQKHPETNAALAAARDAMTTILIKACRRSALRAIMDLKARGAGQMELEAAFKAAWPGYVYEDEWFGPRTLAEMG